MRAQSALIAALLITALSINAEEIGKVDTKFKLLSPDDSIKLEVFDDPQINGVSCYLTRAEVGGYKGAAGIAEDTSDASLDCQQVGPVEINGDLDKGDLVFSERRSLIFKKLRVVRFCDEARNTIVYMVYSEKLIDGSPKNSVSAVPIKHWTQTAADAELAKCVY